MAERLARSGFELLRKQCEVALQGFLAKAVHRQGDGGILAVELPGEGVGLLVDAGLHGDAEEVQVVGERFGGGIDLCAGIQQGVDAAEHGAQALEACGFVGGGGYPFEQRRNPCIAQSRLSQELSQGRARGHRLAEHDGQRVGIADFIALLQHRVKGISDDCAQLVPLGSGRQDANRFLCQDGLEVEHMRVGIEGHESRPPWLKSSRNGTCFRNGETMLLLVPMPCKELDVLP